MFITINIQSTNIYNPRILKSFINFIQLSYQSFGISSIYLCVMKQHYSFLSFIDYHVNRILRQTQWIQSNTVYNAVHGFNTRYEIAIFCAVTSESLWKAFTSLFTLQFIRSTNNRVHQNKFRVDNRPFRHRHINAHSASATNIHFQCADIRSFRDRHIAVAVRPFYHRHINGNLTTAIRSYSPIHQSPNRIMWRRSYLLDADTEDDDETTVVPDNNRQLRIRQRIEHDPFNMPDFLFMKMFCLTRPVARALIDEMVEKNPSLTSMRYSYSIPFESRFLSVLFRKWVIPNISAENRWFYLIQSTFSKNLKIVEMDSSPSWECLALCAMWMHAHRDYQATRK